MASAGASQRTPPRPRRDLALRLTGLVSVLAGITLLGVFAMGTVTGIRQSKAVTATWRQQLAVAPAPVVAELPPPPNLMQPVDGVDFALRVPKLAYFAAVREGVDSTILYSGPGHYGQTPWPGQVGVVGVAAHNVYWIDFPRLAGGDEIDLETRYGTFRYAVTGSRIVEPDDLTILVQAPGHHLVLTTCWPIWAGSFATQRYIVFADQLAEPAVAAG